MAKEFKLSMVLSARDAASKVITKLMRDSTKESQNAEKAQEKLGKRQRTTAEEGIRQNRALGEEVRRQNRARETLGVRAERAIQREIQQTVAAYNRLARSGTLSIDEQSRAYSRMRQRVGELKTEMQGMNKLARMSDIAGGIAKVGGALVAGGMAFSKPIENRMSYEERLAYMSNTAFSDRDAKGRIEGISELDLLVRKAVKEGGGTKESGADLLDKMLAKGVFSQEDIVRLLPDLQAYATMTQVNGEELTTVLEALKDYGVSDPDQVIKALDMSIKAGQEGAFEFTNMARWLPKQLASAKVLGYSGLDGYAKLLSFNQGAMATAGSQDEAGNNLSNLLAKLMSSDLVSTAKGIKVDGYGIDITQTILDAKKNGIDPVTAITRLTDIIAKQNPEFNRIQSEIAKTPDNSPERKNLLEEQNRILEGSAVGKLITDQQARMAILAMRSRQSYVKEVESEVNKQQYAAPGQGEGAIQKEVLFGLNSFKLQQAKNEADFAEIDSVKPMTDALGSLAERFTDFSQEFPGLTTAVMGAKTGIEAMTQAAIAFAALKFLFGGDGLPGVSGGKSSPLPTGAGAGAKSSGLFGRWGSLVGWSMIATELATLTSPEEDEAVMGSEERWKSIRANYPQSMIDAAREKYQPWYQFGEGYSTENEAWLQRYIKENGMPTFASGIAGNEIKNTFERNGIPKLDSAINNDVITYDTLEKSGVLQPLLDLTQALKNPPPPPVIEVRSVVELDGQQVAESVNRVNGQDAGRTTGGMFP